jgi:PAS domain S-box-containing protein
VRQASHLIVQAFSLIADPTSLAGGRELIGESAREAGFPEDRVFDIRVACSEAMANAIEHAPVKNHIEITVSLYRGRLEVQVEDPGEFQAPHRPDLRPHRGLGLPLMAKLADHLALYSGPRGGTLVSLTFYRPGGEREETDILPPSIRKLVEENELFAAITDNAPVGIYVLSPDLRFRWANQTYLGFLDEPYRSGDLVGSYFADVVPGASEAGLIAGLQEASKTGKQVVFEEYQLSGFSRGTTWWRRTVVPLKEDEGVGPYDLLVVVSDETQQMRTQQALMESKKDLDRAQEVGHIGWWRLDTRTDVLTWSDENYRIFGVPKGTPLSYESFLETLHPDDRAYVDEQWNASLRGEPYDVEHRVVSRGQVKWVKEKAYLEFDDGGRLLGGFGITQDITERKRAEEELLETEERFRTMANAIPQLAWMANADGYIYWYNQRWYEYTGTSLAEMEGWGWQSVHDPDVLPAVLARWKESIASGQPFDMEFPLRGADGEFRPFLTRVMPLRDAAGRVTQWFGTNTDMTERNRAEEARRKNEESLTNALSFAGRLRLFERRKAWLVLPIGFVSQVALFLGVDQLGSPSRYLGIPGAAAALIGVLVAIAGGPTLGIAVALAGGAAYVVFLADFGRSVAWPAIVVSILLWTLAAAVAGLAGDWVRRNATKRERLLAHMLGERETLADSLGVANAGLAARNEELQEAQQEIARLFDEQSSLVVRLQEALLDIPQNLPGVEFAHLYQSATRQAQVGGDFYDVFEAKHGRVGLLIGDVSGHGVEAARIATLVKDTIHAFAHQFRRPRLVLRETNRLLVEMNMPGFVTVFLGFLDRESGMLVYSSAGHPPPLLATDGQIALLQSMSVPLGVFADARYRDTETDIQEGSLLLLYTDGITEARRDADFFGEKRLVKALRGVRSGPIDALPSLLLDEALGFSGGLLRDDVALLVVKYLGMTGGLGPSEREQA